MKPETPEDKNRHCVALFQGNSVLQLAAVSGLKKLNLLSFSFSFSVALPYTFLSPHCQPKTYPVSDV